MIWTEVKLKVRWFWSPLFAYLAMKISLWKHKIIPLFSIAMLNYFLAFVLGPDRIATPSLPIWRQLRKWDQIICIAVLNYFAILFCWLFANSKECFFVVLSKFDIWKLFFILFIHIQLKSVLWTRLETLFYSDSLSRIPDTCMFMIKSFALLFWLILQWFLFGVDRIANKGCFSFSLF
jgi:hypothetical protein